MAEQRAALTASAVTHVAAGVLSWLTHCTTYAILVVAQRHDDRSRQLNGVTMAHIDIDVTVSTFVEMRDYMWALLDGSDVEFAITHLVSSAGGWPEVRLTGPADQLAEVVRAWAGEDGDPDYHVSRISAA